MQLRICAICLVLLLNACAFGQNPFGDGGGPFGTGDNPFEGNSAGGQSGSAGAGDDFGVFGQPNSPMAPAGLGAVANAEVEDPDPVVRLLRASPPKSETEMAEGLTWMTRIKRWDEVGRLLDQIASEKWSLTRRSALARAAGPSIWLRIRSDESELTDTQRKLVSEILSSPSKLARNPQWIDQWIAKLGSKIPGERRLAQLRLQDGSMLSVERLVTRLMDGDEKVPPIMLAGTVCEFGDLGLDALKTACLVNDPQQAGRVCLALAELSGSDFNAVLGAGLVGGLLTPQVQSELAETLSSKYENLPNVENVARFLEGKFEDQLAHYQAARNRNSDLMNQMWTLAPDRRSIRLVEGTSAQVELERLAQLGVLRMRVSRDPVDWVDCGTVRLQRAYQMDPQIPSGEIGASLLADLPTEAAEDDALDLPHDQYWQAVFERAGDLQMHGAALRALQRLAQEPNLPQTSLDFLSDRLRDARPAIRYTALEALAKIDPKVTYRGAETAVGIALEMTRLAPGPNALVIGLQSELRQVAQQQLQTVTGADVKSVNSARGALLVLDGEDPVELICIVDRLADQSIFEFLQRVRKSKKGHSLPIAVLTDQLYSHERKLINATPGVVVSVLSRNTEQMKRVVDQMHAQLDTNPMTPADRTHFMEVAGGFLARIAGDRDQYAFYPVGDWREHLVSAHGGLSATTRPRLLSGLGSPASQRELVELAAIPGADSQAIFEAANAFGSSVKRFGMQLSRADVESCYDLYNRIGPQDAEVAKSLGFVLDVIEAQAGKKAWPQGL